MAQTLAAAGKTNGKNAPPPVGHNGLTDETFAQYVNELAKIEAKLEGVKAERRAARKRAKAAGIELGHMDAVVRMSDWSQEEVRNHFATQAQYAAWMGLPLGTQVDLFAKEVGGKASEPHGAEYWNSKGYAAGLRGDLPTPPAECHPEHHPDFKHGWDKGQAKLAPKKLETVN